MRILVECTFVYNHPHINSGIQRVVRNITRELALHRTAVPCLPIVYKRGSPREVVNVKPTELHLQLARAWQYLQTPRHKFWVRHSRIEEHEPFKSSRNWRRALYVMARAIDLVFLLPLAFLRFAQHWLVDRTQLKKLNIQPDDILLLLDSSWHASSFGATEALKRQGVTVIAVIYDVIPVTHPQFFDAPLAKTYQRWFNWITHIADGIVTISKTVAAQAQEALGRPSNTSSSHAPWYDYFYLGSELDLIDEKCPPSENITANFTKNKSTYLAVSTIEPRKNQSYLLDAFELLWQQDMEVSLCIVGKVGWRCENFVQRVHDHPEFGRRLFMHNNATDTDLNYCYTHAKALLFPSIIEGFGLPIVEAMQRGLPVMASDIPVFREVGGDFIAYFDLQNPSSLAALVENHEQSGEFPASKSVSEWRWVNWNEAAQMLISKIINHTAPAETPQDIADDAVTRANCS